MKNYNEADKILNAAISLVMAGGIGNLIDRIFRGRVIDYIDINNIFQFPIFNLADIFVVVGSLIIILYLVQKTIKEIGENKSGRI